MGETDNTYVDALKNVLPSQYSSGVQTLPSPTLHLLESILRFTNGGECPEDAEKQTQENWKAGQDRVRKVFDGLNTAAGSNGHSKRARDDEVEEDHAVKKPRTQETSVQEPSSSAPDEDDSPQYTLHALSLQAPLRKKLDIVICKHTLRLINPSSKAVEASIPLSSLKRAFLLNTRGKTKAHWTVVILASDTVAPKATGKAAQAAAAAAVANGTVKPEERQIVFGIDAVPVPYATTDHTASGAERTAHPKGTPILPQLRTFLSHLPIPYTEPDTAVFRSAASGSDGEPIAGVSAYRAAKEGTLWFLNEGILWDGRPCEYWDVADLVPSTTFDDNGSESVRFVSATGKTASVYIRRRIPASPRDGADGEDEDEEEEYVEASFNPVEAKEQQEIVRWVKRRRAIFGVTQKQANGAAGSDAKGKGKATDDEEKVDTKGKGKAVAIPDEDSDDSNDEDFTDGSDTDDGATTTDDDDDGDNDGGSDAAEESGSEGAEDEDAAGDEDDEGDMDPKHHPLLRAGAMPRMSKAAMNMAVGMASESMFGAGSSSGAGGSHKQAGGSGKGKEESDEEDPESEEDELDE